MAALLKNITLFSPLWFYTASAWYLRACIEAPSVSTQAVYWGQLLVFIICLLLYLATGWLRRDGSSAVPLLALLLLAVALPALTPSVMQTDQLRYIWNGLNTVRGINPYSMSPELSTEFAVHWWVALINFPELRTIYPPAAEILFALAAILNPFSYRGVFADPGNYQNLWQLELGLALVQGCSLALTLYFLKTRQRLNFLLNPLVVICLIGNKHIESLLLPFIAILFYQPIVRKNSTITGICIAIGAGIKWLPLIMLPIMVNYRRHLLKYWLEAAAVAITLIFFIFTIFQPAILSALAESHGAYASRWEFFAFIFAGLSKLGLSATSAKLILAGCGFTIACYLTGLRYKENQPASSRLLALWLAISFYAFMPTLHPWYLSVLLLLGLPYYGILWTPIVWPSTAFISQLFYIDNRFPAGLQFGYYLVVACCISRDLFRSRRYLRVISPTPSRCPQIGDQGLSK